MKSDPFAEGADARLAGQPETANPYDPDEDFDSFASWNDGWASIADEVRDVQFSFDSMRFMDGLPPEVVVIWNEGARRTEEADMQATDDFVFCAICGQRFTYRELARDRALGKLIGGTPGVTCDDCTAIIVNGSPAELDALLDNAQPQTKNLLAAVRRAARA